MQRRILFLLMLIIMGLGAHASWVIWSRANMPLHVFKQPTYVTGSVLGMPEYQQGRVRFVLATRVGRIRLSWYGHYPLLRPTETWRLLVKSSRNLSKVSSGFNYPHWLKWHGFVSAAYVVGKGHNIRLSQADWATQPLNSLRYQLRWQLVKATKRLAFRDILIALAMGDRSYLTSQRWQVFVHTGTSHLIAISGLHVGLLAGIVFFLLRWLFSAVPVLTNRIPAQHLAMAGAVLAAGIYSMLAGLAVTTIRAFVMLAVVALGMWQRRKLSLLTGWLWALLLIVLLMPGQFSAAGAWLSFGAVAWLYYTFAGRMGKTPKLFLWWYPQWALFIGLAPLTLYWFGKWSVVSLIANVVAIPVISFIVLPLALLGTLLAYPDIYLAHAVFWLANQVLAWLWFWLSGLAAQPWWGFTLPPVHLWQCLVASIGAAWLLAPRAFPARWLGWILLGCLFL